MRIVFINPSYFTPEEALRHREKYIEEIRGGNMYYYPFEPPVGLASIAEFLKRDGHDTEIIDMQGDHLALADVLIKLKGIIPDIIGLSAMTPTIRITLDIAKSIKDEFKNIPIIFGGVHPTVSPETVLSHDFIDFVVRGEGEEVLSKFFKQGLNNPKGIKGLCWKCDDNGLQITDKAPLIKDINNLPFPDYNSFPVEKYIEYTENLRGIRGITMMVTRGCPYNCSFCAVKETMGKKWRHLDPVHAAEWMMDTCAKYNLEGIWFKDSTFNIDRNWTKRFAETLISRKNKYLFQINTRVDLVREDEISSLKKAGLAQVDLGIESGSPESLKTLKKKITVEQINSSVKILKKNGLKVSGFFMIGIPGETEKDISMTVALARELDLDRGSVSIYIPLPGSELYDIHEAKGEIKKKPEYFEYHHFTEARESSCEVSIERLREIHAEMNRYFLNR